MSELAKQEYLYASINDLQSSIRAVDSKISYLLVLLFIPLTKLHAIYETIYILLVHRSPFFCIASELFSVSFVVLWLAAFWCSLRTLTAIDNPMLHIDGDSPESLFFPAHLYKHGFWATIGFSRSKSKAIFLKHYNRIPDTGDEIAKQLTLEQMKLMYILSLKLKRSQYAYTFTVLWATSGGVLWFLNLMCR